MLWIVYNQLPRLVGPEQVVAPHVDAGGVLIGLSGGKLWTELFGPPEITYLRHKFFRAGIDVSRWP